MENDCCAPNIEYVRFNHVALIENPTLLKEFAEFYCSIWMNDPAFGEYRKCLVCNKYYNKTEVEIDGITTCSGVSSPHPMTTLVPGWEPDCVADEELIGHSTKYGDNFFGVYAIDKTKGNIVGFVWGWFQSAESIKERWQEVIANYLGNVDATYFADIAVDPSKEYRKKKIGKKLCGMLTEWMSSAYPESPSFLRTSLISPAKIMFEKAGYRYFADDPEHGDGRIMMMVAQGKELVY